VVKIRLQRRGRKKLPVYKVVAADSRFPRDGRFIEELGHYEPFRTPAMVKIERERVRYWLGVGAQPTDTVRSLLRREGLFIEMNLERKGKSAEEISARLDAWREAAVKRLAAGKSRKQLRREKKAAVGQGEAAETPAAAETAS